MTSTLPMRAFTVFMPFALVAVLAPAMAFAEGVTGSGAEQTAALTIDGAGEGESSGTAMTLQPQSADVVASGTWGTCPWELDADGKLTVHPGVGADSTCDEASNYTGPWEAYAQRVKSVAFVEENGEKVIAPRCCNCLFSGFSNMTELDLAGFDSSAAEDIRRMFFDCSSLTSLDLSGFDTSNVTFMSEMFWGCSSLASLDLSGFKTSKVKYMGNLFTDCSSLTSLDLSGIATSKVTDMAGMFWGCSSLASLDLSGFKTSKVRNMSNMFYGCTKLSSLDLSGFKTSKVKDTSCMFADCPSLASLDLSGFDTSKVQRLSYMFDGCTKLTSLNLSGFKTSRVKYMEYLFRGCSSLAYLNLSSFNMSNAYRRKGMFEGCARLARVVVGADFAATLPSYKVSGHVDWFSREEGAWFTAKQIASERAGIADMYTKHETRKGIAKAKVSVSNATYTGEPLKPAPRVKLDGKVLKEGIDYTVSYRDNWNAGKATVTVTGKGDYAGHKSATFKIAKAAQPMTAKGSSKAAKASKLKKKAVTIDGGVTVANAQGSVTYKNASTQKAAKKFKVNRKSGAVTVPKGTKKGTYTVKVKATAKGNANYKSGSKTVTVKVAVK